MKKKLVIILILLFIITAAVFCYFTLKPQKISKEYIDYPLTFDMDINDKMVQLKESINEKIMFEPVISHKTEVSEIIPDSPESAKSNSKILNDIIKKANSNTEIVIPEGQYYLASPLVISKKSNIKITSVGDGATFINTSYSPYSELDSKKTPNIFYISSSENIRIENISFDYQSNVSADGIIVGYADGKTYFKLFDEFHNNEKQRITGGELVTSVFTANNDVFLDESWQKTAVVLNKKTDEIYYVPQKIGTVGEMICCRFTSHGPYVSYVIYAKDTKGLILENLRCFSCPGGFILATEGNSDLYCKGLCVKVSDGSERLLASNEDCLHLRDIAGSLTLLDSEFIGIGDDALNIHSGLATCGEIRGDKVKALGKYINVYTFVNAGDTVEFFDKNYNSIGFSKVKSRGIGGITFESLPEGLESGFYMQNVTLSPDTVINNCKVSFARARGFLVQSKNCVISNCDFKNIRLSAILAAPDFEYWGEGGFSDNLLIENNSFDNCSALNNGMGVIQVSTSHDNPLGNKKCTLGHKNVSIINNEFSNCESFKVRTYAVQNLKK